MAKTIIKKREEDTSIMVIAIISSIMILTSILGCYIYIKEHDGKKMVLEKVKETTQNKQRDLEAVVEKTTNLSNRLGWLSHDERKITTGEIWNNYDNLKGFLNRMVEYFSTGYQITDYMLWEDTETAGKKKLLNLEELITNIERLTQQNIQKNIESVDNRNKSWREIDKVAGTKDEKGELYKNIDEKTDEIIKIRNDIAALETQIKSIIEQGERDVLVLQEGIKEINTKIIDETKKGEDKIAQLTKEKKEFEDRLEKLQRRLELESEGIEIDGEIILADVPNGYVYIDLGRKDAVINGMDFDVFAILKGGIKKEKGKVKLIKIFDDYSQATIIPASAKQKDVMTKGDLVNSDIYNRQKLKTFIFAGTPIGKYLLDDLKKKIEEFGGRVLSEVTHDITYVIIGKNFENDENYKKALYLGAVVLREKELYDLLRLEWKD